MDVAGSSRPTNQPTAEDVRRLVANDPCEVLALRWQRYLRWSFYWSFKCQLKIIITGGEENGEVEEEEVEVGIATVVIKLLLWQMTLP